MESIETICRSNLKAVIGAYRTATKRDLSSISKELYGHSDALGEFLKGTSSITLRKLDEVIGKLIPKWPAGAEFPYLESVIFPRPERRK